MASCHFNFAKAPLKTQPKVVPVGCQVPKEMDIFFRDEKSFLPKGKMFEDLTDEELKKLKSQYRFSPFIPGIPQTLSGFNRMI